MCSISAKGVVATTALESPFTVEMLLSVFCDEDISSTSKVILLPLRRPAAPRPRPAAVLRFPASPRPRPAGSRPRPADVAPPCLRYGPPSHSAPHLLVVPPQLLRLAGP